MKIKAHFVRVTVYDKKSESVHEIDQNFNNAKDAKEWIKNNQLEYIVLRVKPVVASYEMKQREIFDLIKRYKEEDN